MSGRFSTYNSYSPDLGEKIISILSYLSAGMVGFIWMIIAYATGKTLKPFLKFHSYQSIFISILYYVLTLVLGILISFLKIIPFIGALVINLVMYINQYPLFLGYSIVQTVVILVIGYLIFCCIKGIEGNIYWISDNVRRMI